MSIRLRAKLITYYHIVQTNADEQIKQATTNKYQENDAKDENQKKKRQSIYLFNIPGLVLSWSVNIIFP